MRLKNAWRRSFTSKQQKTSCLALHRFAATVKGMRILKTWLSRNVVIIGVLGGSFVAVTGVTLFVGLISARYLGTFPGVSLGATVAGVSVSRGALLWSRLAIVEETTK